jgi:DnaJ-class molecular chaperone
MKKLKPTKAHAVRCDTCRRLKAKNEFPMVPGPDGRKRHSPTCNKCTGKGKGNKTPSKNAYGNFVQGVNKPAPGVPSITPRPEDFKDVITSLDKPITFK